mmetsp:Transcript_24951/g.55360  ORF Transcript_24951/g.55360 Transcript_24951/m.55360 type:complete len:214 (-) Transcript_24951:920-1561(-)
MQDGLDRGPGGGGGHRGVHGREDVLREDRLSAEHRPRGVQPSKHADGHYDSASGHIASALLSGVPASGPHNLRCGGPVLHSGADGCLHTPSDRDSHHHHPSPGIQGALQARRHRDSTECHRGHGGHGHPVLGQDGHHDAEQDGAAVRLPHIRSRGIPIFPPQVCSPSLEVEGAPKGRSRHAHTERRRCALIAAHGASRTHAFRPSGETHRGDC